MKELFTKGLAFVTTWWKVALAFIAAVVLSYQVGSCTGYSRGKAVMQQAIDRANVAFLQIKAQADAVASRERITDTIAISRQEGALRDAIASTPDTQPDAVRIALGCQRLRAAGTAPASLPAVCRSASGAQTSASH